MGVLDFFWEEKGYVMFVEFCWFCNSMVLLVCLDKWVFINDEYFFVDIEIVYFGVIDFVDVVVCWKFVNDNG